MPDFMDFFDSYLENQNQLMLEMSLSLSLDSDVDILNKPDQNKLQFQHIHLRGRFIEKISGFGLPYELWNFPGQAQFALALLLGGKVVLMVEYNKISDDSIKIAFTNSHQSFRGITQQFFIDYLLNKFSVIISDNVHTASAYRFYQNLATKINNFNNKYDLYILNEETGEEELITDVKQMDRTYGNDLGKFDYCYKIVKKNG